MRMKIRRRKKEQRVTAVLGGVCGLLAAGLALVLASGGVYIGTIECLYTGSAILFEGVGGYVLTAVIAFMVGVVITVIIKWNLAKKNQNTNYNEKAKLLNKKEQADMIDFLGDDTLLQAAGGKNRDSSKEHQDQKEKEKI